MELQNSREYKAAQELERALNDMGWSPKRFAESTRFYHRTCLLYTSPSPRDTR